MNEFDSPEYRLVFGDDVQTSVSTEKTDEDSTSKTDDTTTTSKESKVTSNDYTISSSSIDIDDSKVTTTFDNSDYINTVEDSSYVDKYYEKLDSIDSGIKHIVAIGLLIIAFLIIWQIFNHWYFDGV